MSFQIRHFVTDTCLEKPTGKSIRNQPTGLATVSPCSSNNDLMQMFVMAYESNDTKVGSIATDESVCLDISSQSVSEMKPKVHIIACSGSERQKWMYSEEVSWYYLLNRCLVKVLLKCCNFGIFFTRVIDIFGKKFPDVIPSLVPNIYLTTRILRLHSVWFE